MAKGIFDVDLASLSGAESSSKIEEVSTGEGVDLNDVANAGDTETSQVEKPGDLTEAIQDFTSCRAVWTGTGCIMKTSRG